MNILFGTWKSLFSPREFNYLDDDNYRQAEQWYMKFSPQRGVDYTPALQEAREEYDRTIKATGEIELKAESLFKAAAVVVGLIFSGARFSSLPFWLFLPALLLLMLSLALLMMVRKTLLTPSPMGIPSLIQQLEELDSGNQVTGRQAAAFHCCHVGYGAIRYHKAMTYDRAARVFTCGLISLLLPCIWLIS